MKDKTAPVRIGKGSRKVAIYPPTTASAYYRISYHLGGKRIQRTRRTLEEARKEAQAILDKLGASEVTVAQATPLDIAALQAAKLELHGLNVRLDRAVADYAQAKRLLGDIPLQEVTGDDDAKVLVVSWGGTFGACTTAVQQILADGGSVAHAHLRYLNPLPRNLGDLLERHEKVLVPELNLGQLNFILRANFLKETVSLNKVEGRPFTVSELVDKINNLL